MVIKVRDPNKVLRLIDAYDAQKELIDAIDWLREENYETYSAIGDNITFILSKQSTAYDVNKVIGQLDNYPHGGYINVETMNDIIEIVKDGWN